GRAAVSSRCAGHNRGRCGRSAGGGFEPHRQRGEVFGQRCPGYGGDGQGRRELCGVAGDRPRTRHREDRAEADLQALLPGAGRAGDAREGDGTGPVYRAVRGQTARRPRLGRERGSGARGHFRSAASHCEMSRILVVEDEQHLAEGLRFNLEAEGYQVQVVDTGEAALGVLRPESPPFDVVILDVMLPGIDGFDVMSEMRHCGQFVPTLMLTARGHPDDVLRGFAAGADDYLPQPFELAILIARISGLLRRREWLRASMNHVTEPHAVPDETFTFGDKSMYFDRLELHVRDQVFPLTLMEANVLRYLIRHEGKPVSRRAMLEEVWGLHEDTDTRAIDNFIVRLRRYLEDDPTHPRHLLTVRGVGYRFVAASHPWDSAPPRSSGNSACRAKGGTGSPEAAVVEPHRGAALLGAHDDSRRDQIQKCTFSCSRTGQPIHNSTRCPCLTGWPTVKRAPPLPMFTIRSQPQLFARL